MKMGHGNRGKGGKERIKNPYLPTKNNSSQGDVPISGAKGREDPKRNNMPKFVDQKVEYARKSSTWEKSVNLKV